MLQDSLLLLAHRLIHQQLLDLEALREGIKINIDLDDKFWLGDDPLYCGKIEPITGFESCGLCFQRQFPAEKIVYYAIRISHSAERLRAKVDFDCVSGAAVKYSRSRPFFKNILQVSTERWCDSTLEMCINCAKKLRKRVLLKKTFVFLS